MSRSGHPRIISLHSRPSKYERRESDIDADSPSCRSTELMRKDSTPGSDQGNLSLSSVFYSPLSSKPSPKQSLLFSTPKSSVENALTSFALHRNSSPSMQLTPMPVKRKRGRPRINSILCQAPPCSPIIHATSEHKVGRPRQIWNSSQGVFRRIASSSSTLSCVDMSPFESTGFSFNQPRVPHNTPTSEDGKDYQRHLDEMQQRMLPQLHSRMNELAEMDYDPRYNHNEKERNRRLRIKIASEVIQGTIPFPQEKKDNAGVFEHAVRYITFMREKVGTAGDKDFISNMYLY